MRTVMPIATAESESITFIVDLTVAVDVRLAYHLIDLSICQSLTEIVHHLYSVITAQRAERIICQVKQ